MGVSTGFCCACSGSCMHVGAHHYCAAHGGTWELQQQEQPIISIPSIFLDSPAPGSVYDFTLDIGGAVPGPVEDDLAELEDDYKEILEDAQVLYALAEQLLTTLAFLRKAYVDATSTDESLDVLLHTQYSEAVIFKARTILYPDE